MNSKTYFKGKMFFLFFTPHFFPSKGRKIWYLAYQFWNKWCTDESATILNMNFYPCEFQFKHLLTAHLSRRRKPSISRFNETNCV